MSRITRRTALIGALAAWSSLSLSNRSSAQIVRPADDTMQATLKWFCPRKGYGIITPADGSAEALVIRDSFRTARIQLVRDGMRLTARFKRHEKHPEARLVTDILAAEVVNWRFNPAPVPCGPAIIEGVDVATVKWFNRVRGFGFVACDDDYTQDIFVHLAVLQYSNLIEMRPGERYRAYYGRGSKGLMAAALEPVTS